MFRVQGSGFRVQVRGLGHTGSAEHRSQAGLVSAGNLVEGLGSRVQGLRFWGLGFIRV